MKITTLPSHSCVVYGRIVRSFGEINRNVTPNLILTDKVQVCIGDICCCNVTRKIQEVRLAVRVYINLNLGGRFRTMTMINYTVVTIDFTAGLRSDTTAKSSSK